MTSTVFENHTMGGNPNNNYRFMNSNPNPKPKSKKSKNHSINGHGLGHGHKHHNQSDSIVVTQAAPSEDAYSYNQRHVVDNSTFNYGGYVSYNVSKCSKSEINELRNKLVADLEKIRNLNERIQAGEILSNPNGRSANGKYKRPFGSVIGSKETKLVGCFADACVNGGKGGEFDDDLLKMCKQVLSKVMKHKLSWVFKKPVDAVALGLHDYHQIVKKPMDLGTVKSSLSRGGYVYVNDFANDVRLVFENAMLYNPKTDQVHGMADQLLRMFEDLFGTMQAEIASRVDRVDRREVVNDVRVDDVVNDVVNHVNEFSAVDELDGSSWDDIPTPDRSKKMKSSATPGVPAVSNQQNHSTASNPIVPPVVHSSVRMERTERIEQMERTPSPMQAVETVKPSSTAARVFPKLPKPRAKDLDKREMNMEEKQKLGLGLQSMPPEKMPQLLQIIRKRNDQLAQEGDEIELDIEALDTETLWELDRFVTNWKKHVSKTKRQALMVNGASGFAAPSLSADIDDVPMGEKIDGMKNKKEAGEEDVDIGDEMPESSFPHVEIEKDDGIGGQGQVTGGGGQGTNGNASSSSSGSSSSSSSGSSSSSDSDSGSSSGSDSDADDAQS